MHPSTCSVPLWYKCKDIKRLKDLIAAGDDTEEGVRVHRTVVSVCPFERLGFILKVEGSHRGLEGPVLPCGDKLEGSKIGIRPGKR